MGIDPMTHSPRLDLLDLSSILSSSLYNQSEMNISSIPFSNEAQLNADQFPSNFTDISDWQWKGNGIPSSLTEDYVPITPNYNYYASNHQTVMDPSSEASNFHSNNSNQSFSFTLVLSTPSSSPTPLNSNSTYINSSNTDDERESYCSKILKFEIPEFQHSQTIVFALSKSTVEAQLFLEALEHGLGGVVLKAEDVKAVLDLKEYFDRRNKVHYRLSLTKATVTQVHAVGMGDRVCVDLCSFMRPHEIFLRLQGEARHTGIEIQEFIVDN
ncbi:hypothetical protein REPUB_Repub01dG0157300 [Reevesia pubescens]